MQTITGKTVLVEDTMSLPTPITRGNKIAGAVNTPKMRIFGRPEFGRPELAMVA